MPFAFNKQIHKSPNQSFRDFLHLWKDESAYRVSEKWFKWRNSNIFMLSSPNNK